MSERIMAEATQQTFDTIIGLEVHLQLNTKTKIFCGCANRFGEEPNSLTCPVCLGLPGTLPVLNQTALEYAIKVTLALNCQINTFVKFDRKNYYYPDLPKGYQISQYDKPLANHGHLIIPTANGPKRINIKRSHLEEDAGKLIHDDKLNCSLVDYNRTGTPLLEIVTEPDLHSPQEAHDYLTILKLTLQYLNVSDCDMEKGSLRCDANVSIRPQGETKLGAKTELKNMNSFRAVKAALEFEVNRQRRLILTGERIVQETRLWDEEKNITVSMRSKEEAHDYRYFPEPDLVPLTIDSKIIEKIRLTLPELPDKKLNRFMEQYGLSQYDAHILIQEQDIANFFERCTEGIEDVPVKKIANWIIGPMREEISANKKKIEYISIREFLMLIRNVEEGKLSNLAAKDVLSVMVSSGENIEKIIAEKGLAQIMDETILEKIVVSVLAENPKVVEQIQQGKESATGFLVGQAMRKSQGKGNPKKFGEIIKRRLQHG